MSGVDILVPKSIFIAILNDFWCHFVLSLFLFVYPLWHNTCTILLLVAYLKQGTSTKES